MDRITITWNPEKDPETKVTFSPGFVGLPDLDKADCLVDAIRELEDYYDKLVGSDNFLKSKNKKGGEKEDAGA